MDLTPATTATSGNSSSTADVASPRGAAARQQLRGRGFAEQQAMLSPTANPYVNPSAGAGATHPQLQRKPKDDSLLDGKTSVKVDSRRSGIDLESGSFSHEERTSLLPASFVPPTIPFAVGPVPFYLKLAPSVHLTMGGAAGAPGAAASVGVSGALRGILGLGEANTASLYGSLDGSVSSKASARWDGDGTWSMERVGLAVRGGASVGIMAGPSGMVDLRWQLFDAELLKVLLASFHSERGPDGLDVTPGEDLEAVCEAIGAVLEWLEGAGAAVVNAITAPAQIVLKVGDGVAQVASALNDVAAAAKEVRDAALDFYLQSQLELLEPHAYEYGYYKAASRYNIFSSQYPGEDYDKARATHRLIHNEARVVCMRFFNGVESGAADAAPWRVTELDVPLVQLIGPDHPAVLTEELTRLGHPVDIGQMSLRDYFNLASAYRWIAFTLDPNQEGETYQSQVRAQLALIRGSQEADSSG